MHHAGIMRPSLSKILQNKWTSWWINKLLIQDLAKQKVITVPEVTDENHCDFRCICFKHFWVLIFAYEILTEDPLDESERQWKSWLKTNIQKMKTMASNPITSWQIDGKAMETVTDYFRGLQDQCRWWLQQWN